MTRGQMRVFVDYDITDEGNGVSEHKYNQLIELNKDILDFYTQEGLILQRTEEFTNHIINELYRTISINNVILITRIRKAEGVVVINTVEEDSNE